MSCNVICLLNNCIGRSVAAEPGTEGAFAPSLFGVGATNVKCPPPTFPMGHFKVALKCPKLVKFLRSNGSDGFRLRYFTPKFQKFSRATLISGGVNLQHDNDWNRVYR